LIPHTQMHLNRVHTIENRVLCAKASKSDHDSPFKRLSRSSYHAIKL
jgi:hypothetical protein